ncbi:hypothetical protein L2E82_48467 [Cichorium intybus]|uniref:Uncharacterized protein n=1 Tax=Cichorium intybus TaxID=13427 RepID=A0ACB8YYC4_CICIN|nr:hypothetical protein L2E82_48467 [Cichorium intybus]
MEAKSILHMNIGNGESSYANNSSVAETAVLKTMPVLKNTIKDMANRDIIFIRCFKMADLGCSSSPNSLLVAFNVINIVRDLCEEEHREAPQFQLHLNDLFENDFNNLLKMVPKFYSDLKNQNREGVGPCFVSATPGSFYGRLFPDQSLHLVHSTYGVHWLSQVPYGVESNISNIYIAKSSPPDVLKAYKKQFDTDFKTFLQMRSEEIVHGGCMVLTVLGRSINDPTSDDSCKFWELLAESLVDMVNLGLIQESKLNSFNLPYYSPCEDEVRNIIWNEGSFSLDSMNIFQVNWDPHDTDYTNIKDFEEPSHIHGKITAKIMRAVMEPLLTSHFGNSIVDILFKKYEKRVALHLASKKTRHFNIVISLSRK